MKSNNGDDFDVGDGMEEANIELVDQDNNSALEIHVDDPAEFPCEIMSGAAGCFADTYSDYLEVPAEFFYIGFLTALGSVLGESVTLDTELRPQPRLYTLLLGRSADERKSTTLKKVVELFRDTMTDFHTVWAIGSAEGLEEKLKKCDGAGLLMVFDEFRYFVSKCKIDSSVLLPCITTLFESNTYEANTRNKQISIDNAKLSMLAASTVQTYERIWDSNFIDIGFVNRVFIVPGMSERKFSIPKKVPSKERELFKGQIREILQYSCVHKELPITKKAYEMYNFFYMTLERSVHAKRIDGYALRFMILLAANELKNEIDVDIVQKVCKLMRWQLAVRKRHDPIDCDNRMAGVEEKIRRALSKDMLSERDLQRAVHSARIGTWFYDKAKKNLMVSREIRFDAEKKAWVLI